MLEKLDLTRRLNACTDLTVIPGFDEEFIEQVKEADPILVFNHQAHADGIPASIATEYLLSLTEKSGRAPKLKGFALTVARSLVEGHQSRVMQGFYFPISFLMSRKGLRTISYTREADKDRYGMSRDSNPAEIGTIRKKLDQNYRVAVFAEGGVQGGRHKPGDDPENIFGIQEVKSRALLNAAKLTKMKNGDRPIFFVTIGLHGGFRLQSPNKEMFGPTKGGLATLFGVPEQWTPHVKAEAILGGIIHESTLVDRFGKNWIEAGHGKQNGAGQEVVRAINRIIMEDVARFVPDQAKGVYAPQRETVLV